MYIPFFKDSTSGLDELRKTTEDLAEAGLLNPRDDVTWLCRTIFERYERPESIFVPNMAPDLTLMVFRAAIEERLRELVRRSGLTEHSKNATRLLKALLLTGTLTQQEYDVLRKLLGILSRTKGSTVETNTAAWASRIGPPLIEVLTWHPVPPDLSEFGL